MGLFRDDKTLTIPEFFKKKNILITGGTGFIGRVLIEKVLRSCPDVGNIYLLLREKKGKPTQERVKVLTDVPLFESLKKQDINAVKKIIPIKGDTSKLGLGLNDEDRLTIINNVNIIFNIAASVRFDDPLKKAIFTNVRSTVEMIHLAKCIKKLDILTHVSTAYCVSDNQTIEEKLYTARADWRHAIRIAEEMDEESLEVFTEKYIHPLPNTYTFTKSLAEHAVNDLCCGRIPAIILRPSIVISTLKEPLVGWIDNFNGPFTMAAAVSMGLMRTAYGSVDTVADYIFVDNLVKSIIIASWKQAVAREKLIEIPIYNCADAKVPFDMYQSVGLKTNRAVKFETRIWSAPTSVVATECFYYYYLNVILFHLIPATLIDGLLKILGKQAFVTNLQRKIFIANSKLFYFATHSWDIKTNNYLNLEDKLLQEDVPSFSFRLEDPSSYSTPAVYYPITKSIMFGMKKYLLNESEVIPRRTILIDESCRAVEKIVKAAIYGYVLYLVFWEHNFLAQLYETTFNYFSKLDCKYSNLI